MMQAKLIHALGRSAANLEKSIGVVIRSHAKHVPLFFQQFYILFWLEFQLVLQA